VAGCVTVVVDAGSSAMDDIWKAAREGDLAEVQRLVGLVGINTERPGLTVLVARL
jgi:hypothetical protein